MPLAPRKLIELGAFEIHHSKHKYSADLQVHNKVVPLASEASKYIRAIEILTLEARYLTDL